jgi:hypothetical protein
MLSTVAILLPGIISQAVNGKGKTNAIDKNPKSSFLVIFILLAIPPRGLYN